METILNDILVEEQKLINGFDKKNLKEIPAECKAVIVKFEIKTSKVIYGEKTIDPKRLVLLIHYENASLNIKGYDTVNYYSPESVPYNSKLGKLINSYGIFNIGITIRLLKNEEGYLKIVKSN